MSTDFPPADLPLEHEPGGEDRPADPDAEVAAALPDDERPLDPADAAPAPPFDDDRPVRLDDED